MKDVYFINRCNFTIFYIKENIHVFQTSPELYLGSCSVINISVLYSTALVKKIPEMELRTYAHEALCRWPAISVIVTNVDSWWCHSMKTFSTLLVIWRGQWRGALMFSSICASVNAWINNLEAGDLRRHRTHYDVSVMWPGLDEKDYIECWSAIDRKPVQIHVNNSRV